MLSERTQPSGARACLGSSRGRAVRLGQGRAAESCRRGGSLTACRLTGFGGAALKVILSQDVPRIGRSGDVIDVAEGYARNYLMPRHLAEEATPGALRRWEERRRQTDRHTAHEEAEAQGLAGRLDGKEVRIPVRVGEGGRTFGSVTAKDVADAVLRQLDVRLDKRRYELPQAIKSPGVYPVQVQVHPKFRATVQVVVEEAHA